MKKFLIKNIIFVSLVSLVSCINSEISPLSSKINKSSIDIDTLYSNLKLKDQKLYEDSMKMKKVDDLNLKIKINTDLQNEENSYSISNVNRKKIWLSSEENINNNSKIFDITKELNNFGLKIYEGDIIIDGLKKSKILANGNNELNFIPEVINIDLKDNLKIKNLEILYGAKKIDQYKNISKFFIDIDKADISKLDSLIKEYNKTIPKSIKDIEFSSIASMKTFTILLDIFINHKDIYNSIFIDKIMEPGSSIASKSNYYPGDFEFKTNTNRIKYDYVTKKNSEIADDEPKIQLYKSSISGSVNNNLTDYDKSFWLQETKIVNSFSYGIGTNVSVAHIDSQYFGVNDNIRSEKFDTDSRRTLLNKYNQQSHGILGIGSRNVFSDDKDEIEHHGYGSIMTCCAERNNGIPSVGASPNSYVIPYIARFAWEFAKAIDVAVANGANVISINSSSYYNPMFNWISGGEQFEISVKEAAKKVPVVLNAGNNALNIDEITPTRLGVMSPNDGIIVVGGTDIDSNTANDLTLKAVFDPNFKPSICGSTLSNSTESECNGRGSNYGANVVWAPWTGRYISAYKDSSKKELFNGTSGAEPTVAGLVANMMSRNTNLKPGDIEQIIIGTLYDGTEVKPHNYMLNFKNNYMINAEEAMKMTIRQRERGVNDPTYFKAKVKGTGFFKLEKDLNDNSNNNKPIGTVTLSDGTMIKVLRTASDKEFENANGKIVNLIGWESNVTGLEGFEVLSIIPIDLLIPSPIPGLSINFNDLFSVEPNRFIQNGFKLKAMPGDTVGVAIEGDLTDISIEVGGKKASIQGIIDYYVAFKIPPDVPFGLQDVVIKTLGGNITFTQALDILAANTNTLNDVIYSNTASGWNSNGIWGAGILKLKSNGASELVYSGYHHYPIVSKDQNKIAFIYNGEYNGDYVYNKPAKINMDGSQLEFIETPEDINYYNTKLNISPDFSKIALRRSNISILKNGFDTEIDNSNYSSTGSPVWSPDSNKLAYMAYTYDNKQKIIIHDLTTSQKKEIITSKTNISLESERIVWSDSGNKIFYIYRDNDSDEYNMAMYDFKKDTNFISSNIYKYDSYNTMNTFAISPDEDYVVLADKKDIIEYGYNISVTALYKFKIGENKTELGNLAHWYGYYGNMKWSKDGRYISFESSHNSTIQIFAINSDGTNFRTLVSSGYSANWLK